MKTKVEECRQIPMYPLIKRLLQVELGIDSFSFGDGFTILALLISEGRAKHIQFSYYLGEDPRNLQEIKYRVKLTRTKCHIEGYRYWFTCPILKENDKACGKRVGVLYKPSDQDYFACRHCFNLTYKSRCYSGSDKKFRPIISLPTLNEEEKNIKRRYYRGKHTKRYKRFLKKSSDNWARLGASTDDLYEHWHGKAG